MPCFSRGIFCLPQTPWSVQRGMKKIMLSLGAVLLVAGLASAQSSRLNRDQLYAALSGEWTGQLEYRDFQTDERVLLPTWLEVKPTVDGRMLQFIYVYDDGPTKTVTEQSTVAIDPASHRFGITSDRDHSTQTYEIDEHVGLNGANRTRLILTGKGTENDKPVDVRITVTVDRNMYQFKKETRLAGQEFAFRDGYVFTRRNPGQSMK